MRKRTGLLIILFISLFTSGYTYAQSDLYYNISKSIDMFGRVYKEISQKYVDDIDPKEFMLAGIEGMLSDLDPYTVYIDETDQQDIDVITTGKYGGIGTTVGVRNGKVTIIDLIEGYSAQRQGMRIGDVILKIDSVKITPKNYDELSAYMKGTPGTEVSVTVQRDGVEGNIIFNLVREEVEINNLTYYGFLPEESNNVYLKLSGFSRAAGEEIKDAIMELRKEREIKSIILDLRGNPGGLLDAAIDVSEKFLPKNELIVSVRGRDSLNVKEYYSEEEPIAGDAKLIVLIDGGSASASEIVAGAIQDHDRGVIMGTPSFGKGLVQTVIPMSNTTSLKITTARYYTPSGRCIQKIDYSNDNDVVLPTALLDQEEFRTDRNRKVFSGGGIQPDTLIDNQSGSDLVRDLIAQGAFFRFATHYYNVNEITDWNSVDREQLFNSFKTYFDENKVDFSSRSERLLKELEELAKDEDYGNQIDDELAQLKQSLNDIKTNELDMFKDDVIAELHQEIAARIEGRKGRIRASLLYDGQYKSSLKLMDSYKTYDSLLALADQSQQ